MAAKMAITVFSGGLDRLTGVAMLVSGAAAQDMEVDIFLMLWATHAFRKDVAPDLESFSEFEELKPTFMENRAKANLPPWYEMLAQAKELAPVRVHVCSTALTLVGAEKEDLLDIVDDVVGAGEIAATAEAADATFFV
jgi:peroxiredoxin family protein